MKKTKIKFLAIMTMFLMLANNVKSQVTIWQGTGCMVEIEVEYYDGLNSNPSWVPAAVLTFAANGPSQSVPAPTGYTATDVRVRHTQIGGSSYTGNWVYAIGGSNSELANCGPTNDNCGCYDNYMTFTGSSTSWSFLWY